jgi:GxxExxY protein
MELNDISAQVVDAAIKVHSALGPGLLENTCEVCLKYELEKRGLKVQQQVGLPVMYDGVKMDVTYRLDLLVEREVVVEVKAVETLTAVHEAQLLSYLKLSKRKIGLLINFNVAHLRDGIKRMVNEL